MTKLRKAVPRALVDWTWLELRRAAARHGKHWREALSPARVKLISQALNTARPTEVVRCVDGFARRSADWTEEIRDRCWTPEYILRPTKLDQHIESTLTVVVEPAPVVEVSAEQNICEASELRALGFYGEVGDRR